MQLDARITALGRKVSRKHHEEVQATKPNNTIVEQMEKEAANPRITPRHQSEQEMMVFESLVAKHDDDYQAMARDIKLNKYQLTSGQIKRKIQRLLLKA